MSPEARRAPRLLALLGLTLSSGIDDALPLASAQTITEFIIPTPGGSPTQIALGPDGALWFVESGAPRLGRVTSDGAITEFAIPEKASALAAGPDGNVWFIEPTKLGRIGPTGLVTELPKEDGMAWGITTGPDGNVWLTDAPVAGDWIDRVTPAGTLTRFAIPTPATNARGITVGPDGNLWFTEPSPHKIGRITPAGSITEFQLNGALTLPLEITGGPDGAVWFTSQHDTIGRITVSGSTSAFTIVDGQHLRGITTGPDGNLWFTNEDSNKIGRMTPAGVVTQFTIPTADSHPWGIAAGPDGNLWFTENQGNKVGRITTGIPEGSFFALTPCRVLDTRNPVAPLAGPALVANTERIFSVAGRCCIPVGARALSANVTVTGSDVAGNLRLYAGGEAPTSSSSINYISGQTRANNVVMRLGSGRDVAMRSDQALGTVDVILDVNGYFK
jgi:virginiamycin B lyase